MLVECKNLQGLSDKEMSAYVGIPFFKMPDIIFNFFFLWYLGLKQYKSLLLVEEV
jgi:hypothetical protein